MDVSFSLIDEGGSLIECATKSTNNTLICVFYTVIFYLINFVTNKNSSNRHKNDLVEFIKFVNNKCLLLFKSWLEL